MLMLQNAPLLVMSVLTCRAKQIPIWWAGKKLHTLRMRTIRANLK